MSQLFAKKIFWLVIIVSLMLTVLTGSIINAQNTENNELYFTIVHTNDEHSSLLERQPPVTYEGSGERDGKPAFIGGYARLAGAIEEVKAQKEQEGEPVILAAGGDFLGGTAFGWLSHHGVDQLTAPELSMIQELGYHVVTIGNHEYDYGPDVLAGYLKAAGYPEAHERTAVLASNTIPPADHPLSEAELKSTHIKELENGLKVGFLGLVGQNAIMQTIFTDPVEFEKPVEAARKRVEELEEAGVDVIMAVTHAGVQEDEDLARAVSGIDVIVGGHSHTALHTPIMVNDTIIVQAGYFLQYMGQLELAYNPEEGTLRTRNGESGTPFLTPLEDEKPDQSPIDDQAAVYMDKLSSMAAEITGGKYTDIKDTVAYSSFPLRTYRGVQTETGVGNYVTDAMRSHIEELTGKRVDFAAQGTGLIRSGIYPGTLSDDPEEITFYDVVQSVPLGTGYDDVPGYPVVKCYLTGEDVYKIMEISALLTEYMSELFRLQISGLRYSYDPDRAILFYIPGTNLPVPTTRAVTYAERYTGEGRQTDADADYATLTRNDQDLYLVATDYSLLTALPEVEAQIPWLGITPRDEHGNPVEDHKDLIIHVNGKELKTWQAVLAYSESQPPGEDGVPVVDTYYAEPAGRMTEVETLNPLVWIVPLFLALPGAVIYLIIRRRNRITESRGRF